MKKSDKKKRSGYAVITGASSGLGAEFARQLWKDGYPLILIARREDRLRQLAEELEGLPYDRKLVEGAKGQPACEDEAAGGKGQPACEEEAAGGKGRDASENRRVLVFPADLSREEECRRLLTWLEKKRISIFINNAGFGDAGLFTETDTAKGLQMVDVNVRALYLLTREILGRFEQQKYGYLMNVASSAGLLPAGPYMADYYATKAYVTSLTRAIAQELEEQKSPVYIGCLCPGPVDTEFNDRANVRFALPGITAESCVKDCIRGMKRRKTVIVPTLTMKAAVFFGRFLPQKLLIRITGRQQKKKL